MIIPTKHEKLDENILVLGASILKLLKKKTYLVDDLFRKIQETQYVQLDKFFDTVLMLWLLDFVTLHNNIIRIKDVSEEVVL